MFSYPVIFFLVNGLCVKLKGISYPVIFFLVIYFILYIVDSSQIVIVIIIIKWHKLCIKT